MDVPLCQCEQHGHRGGRISVGKPGCGIVLIFSGSRSPVRYTRRESSNSLNGGAPLFQLVGDRFQMLGDDIFDEHVAACDRGGNRRLPASIRVGMME